MSDAGNDSSPVRGPKRRRLDASPSRLGNVEDGVEGDEYSFDSASQPSTQSTSNTIQASEEHEKSKKLKSKYRIHIPKNPELPQDTFFTQLPERASSPYRIEAFQWRKPPNLSPSPAKKKNPSTGFNSLVQVASRPTTVVSSKLGSNVVVARNPEKESETRATDEDEFSDHSLDDIQPDDLVESVLIDSQPSNPETHIGAPRLRGPLTNLKQTTLFGTQASKIGSQNNIRKRNWPLAARDEPPTHHRLDPDAMKTWTYPTNLGAIRDYQFNIVSKGLYHNMLVALPTGLGKTFIAATVMLNWFRWAPDAQIVFVAPTKPLVSQQVKACFEIAGIPRPSTSMLTGVTAPGIRAEEWRDKRVFFMTPQTIVNDLKSGICDPKRLVLLVVDEAHRATGNYAYVEVVKFVKRFNPSFRVLALTATPGSSIEGVQEVIDGLGISRIEIRTEESIDIRQYVHQRKIETVLFDDSEEIAMVMDLFSKALQPLLDKLTGMNAYWSKDPTVLTPYGCTIARQRWMSSDAGRKAGFPMKAMVISIFSILASLSHGIELLKFHGIAPFYHKALAFRNEQHLQDGKGSKYKKMVNESPSFQTMISRIQIWINSTDFVGHPKLEYVQRVALNHFLDAGEGRGASDPFSTRIMIFSHYRDSAEEIVRILQRNSPMIRPHVFVGQASSGVSEGMDQKKQLDVLHKFKTGIFNTLVATSIGEEGLDIGEVDLIICYDASASPIRMLQRMGRTGRKRTGNIVVTLMRGKEENGFAKAKDSYEKMQAEIASGARFNYHEEESCRIVPKGVQPVVDKRIIEIPVENTQAELPEPKKRGKPPKRPPKKFHMPEGVRTGFMSASRVDGVSDDNGDDAKRQQGHITKCLEPVDIPVAIPILGDVMLSSEEEKAFEKRYLDICGDEPQTIDFPRLNIFPHLQRVPRPTSRISHSSSTIRALEMLNIMNDSNKRRRGSYEVYLTQEDKDAADTQAEKRSKFLRHLRRATVPDPASHEEKDLLSPSRFTNPQNARDRNHDSAGSETISLDEGGALGKGGVYIADEVDDGDLSSWSSPPSDHEDRRPTAQIESDGELPDFDALLGRGKRSSSILARVRRQNREVVCEESDDDE